jgi:hypothetical protein
LPQRFFAGSIDQRRKWVAGHSRGRAPATRPACRCTSTTSPVFKERIYLDKANANILHDEITVIDHALTRPWTVDKQFIRSPETRPVWSEGGCQEGNLHVEVGPENYFVSGDGFPDAGPQESGAARSAVFHQDAENERVDARRTEIIGSCCRGLANALVLKASWPWL